VLPALLVGSGGSFANSDGDSGVGSAEVSPGAASGAGSAPGSGSPAAVSSEAGNADGASACGENTSPPCCCIFSTLFSTVETT
jgi:hypothetical protein